MLIDYVLGQESIVLRVLILDSSVTTGAGKTGLTYGSSGLRISTITDNEATTTTYTTTNLETISTLGTYAAPSAGKCRFKEVDSTSHPGIYEIQIADARFAVSNAKSVLISIVGVTGAAQSHFVIPLRQVDLYDAVNLGLSALPSVAAKAKGGLAVLDTTDGTVLTGFGDAEVHVLADNTIPSVGDISTQVVSDLDTAHGEGSWETAVGFATPTDISDLQSHGDSAWLTATGFALESVWTPEVAALIDVAISTRLAETSYVAPDNSTIGQIDAKTTNLPSDPADASDIETAFGTVGTLIGNVKTDTETIISTFAVLTGLSRENTVEDTIVFDGIKKTSSILWQYDSKANALLHDEVTGLIGKWASAITYSGQYPATIKITKEL